MFESCNGLQVYCCCGSRDSSVRVVTRLGGVEHGGIVDLFSPEARNLYPLKSVHPGSGAHPNPLQWILAAITRAWSSTDRYLIVEVKNKWSTASIPPYAFTAYERTYWTTSVYLQLTKVTRVSKEAAILFRSLRGISSKDTATFCVLGLSGRTAVYRHKNCSGDITSVPASLGILEICQSCDQQFP